MALSDLLSTPFLISLGITLLLVGILGMFFGHRMIEQNHKISSMLGLVTTMAEEMNFMRNHLQMISNSPQHLDKMNQMQMGGQQMGQMQMGGQQMGQMQMGGQQMGQMQLRGETIELTDPLIPVSDDETDSDTNSETDSDSDSESDSESESNKTFIINSSDELVNLEDDESPKIKVVNMGETLNLNYGNEDLENVEDGEDGEEDSEEDDDLESLDDSEPKETIEINNIKDLSEIKSINIYDNVPIIDIKKLSIQSLRTMAIEKGFSGEVSKIKKNELISILEKLNK